MAGGGDSAKTRNSQFTGSQQCIPRLGSFLEGNLDGVVYAVPSTAKFVTGNVIYPLHGGSTGLLFRSLPRYAPKV